jgi:hypothetical protein
MVVIALVLEGLVLTRPGDAGSRLLVIAAPESASDGLLIIMITGLV